MAEKRRARRGTSSLKPIGVSEDGLYVLLATRADARSAGFRVAIDEAFVSKLEEAFDRREAERLVIHPEPEPAPPEPEPPKHESKLSIREIQALLRQGRSVSSIAKKAEMDEEWVQRFEGPIIWERAGMATRAQRATLYRSRRGPSSVPLGEAVTANLKARRVTLSPEQFEASWDSIKRPKGGKWAVRFTFSSRGRHHVAEWEYDPETNKVQARNNLAGDLGWVQPRRRRASA